MSALESLAKTASETPQLLLHVYGDLAKPGVEQVGKAIGTILGLGNTILWPLAFLNQAADVRLRVNLEKYRKRMESVPIEQVVPVAPELGVPVAERLSYVSDEDLSALFLNLLASASDASRLGTAHPGFVRVIECLSPDEAKFLNVVRSFRTLTFVTMTYRRPEDPGYGILEDLLTGIEGTGALTFPENIPAYISNCEGLGLLEIRRDAQYEDSGYAALEVFYRPRLQQFATLHPGAVLGFRKGGFVDQTEFGKLFMRACGPKEFFGAATPGSADSGKGQRHDGHPRR